MRSAKHAHPQLRIDHLHLVWYVKGALAEYFLESSMKMDPKIFNPYFEETLKRIKDHIEHDTPKSGAWSDIQVRIAEQAMKIFKDCVFVEGMGLEGFTVPEFAKVMQKILDEETK